MKNHRDDPDPTALYQSLRPGAVEVPTELATHPNFQVSKELGRGGMGVVYQAVDRSLDRLVAIKVVHPTLVSQPDALARFDQEARTAARLSHPNIVQTYAKETAGSLFLLVMEFVDGVDLETYVQQKGLPEPHLACHFVRQAALALQHGLEKGVVHRDIKPNNLMITRKGQLKVMDFGLAKLGNRAGPGEHGLTSATAIMGTADYMAPEQAVSSKDADVRADLYSLGCTLYFLLTGNPPFHRATPLETIVAHQRDPVPEIRDVLPDLPPPVADIVRKLLQKDPAERFQRPAELALVLQPWVRKDAWGSAWNTLVNLDRIALDRVRPGTPLLRGAEFVEMHTPHQPSQYPLVTRSVVEHVTAIPLKPRSFRKKSRGRRTPLWWWIAGLGAAAFLVVLGAILSRAFGPDTTQAREIATTPVLPVVVPSAPATTVSTAPGRKTDYDALATGTWRRIIDEKDGLARNVAFRREGDGIVSDVKTNASLHLPESMARDSILRTRVKKISGQHIALTLRLHGTDAARDVRAYAVWFNGGNWFGMARFENSKYIELGQYYTHNRFDDFFELTMAAVGKRITVYVDGKLLHEEIDPDPRPGVARLTTLKAHAHFQDIEFMSLDGQPERPDPAAYDGLATGTWRRVLEKDDDWVNPRGLRRDGFALSTDGSDSAVVTIGDTLAHDAMIRARVRKLSGQNLGLGLRTALEENGKRRGITVWFNGGNYFGIGAQRDSTWRELAPFHTTRRYDQFFELALAAVGPRIIVFIDGKKVHEAIDPAPIRGTANIGGYKSSSMFKDVEYMRLDK